MLGGGFGGGGFRLDGLEFLGDVYAIGEDFASAEDFQQQGIADLAHFVQLGEDRDVLADQAVVVEVAVDLDSRGLDADVAGGKLEGLVEGALQLLADD